MSFAAVLVSVLFFGPILPPNSRLLTAIETECIAAVSRAVSGNRQKNGCEGDLFQQSFGELTPESLIFFLRMFFNSKMLLVCACMGLSRGRVGKWAEVTVNLLHRRLEGFYSRPPTSALQSMTTEY